MKEYRPINSNEIAQLQRQGCRCDDWSRVTVSVLFCPDYMYNVRMSGDIRLGRFASSFRLSCGIVKHSGIYNATIHNVTVGDDCCIENVKNHIANYDIADNVYIENIGMLYVDGATSFGNGVDVSVLIETGGREVTIHNNLSSQEAYVVAMYRHRPELVSRLRDMARREAEAVRSSRGSVGSHSIVVNADCLKNIMIGEYARIEGTARLTNGSIVSKKEAPVRIGTRVIADDFIVQSNSVVEDGAMLTRCFVGQACSIGHGYTASDSLFFSNCHGENGEACAIFAGPFTVTHHKSTLLIAGMFSFMNAGSGSNQSNHMYKLGPIHQGSLERGAKTTSDSYILWPSRVGAFSLVMGRHTGNSDTSSMPFSYLIEHQGETYIVPGVNLRSVGTVRDAKKWPKRDKRTDPERLDQINYNLLSPFTIQKMVAAKAILKELQRLSGRVSDIYTYQSANIRKSSLAHGLHYYDLAIKKFIGNSVINRLMDSGVSTNEELRARLRPFVDGGAGEWVDLSGLIAPKAEVDKILAGIENGQIDSCGTLLERFRALHAAYYDMEWTWAYQLMIDYFGIDPDSVTVGEIIDIVKQWEEAVLELDRLVYEDARKEFSLASHTGFGVDGSDDVREQDFEQVRGSFAGNSFVMATVEHMEKKRKLCERMVEQLKNVEC